MKRYLVTVTDNIAPTSMPYNEFLLYRRTHVPEEKQIAILLFKDTCSENVSVPEDLELYCVGTNIRRLRTIVKSIVDRAEKHSASYLFHIHEAKSVLLFNLATRGRYHDRIVYTLHSTYIHYAFYNRLLARLASGQCRAVVCVSRTSYKYYPADLKRILGKRVRCIQNGVDTERINGAIAHGKKEGNKVLTLIYVARLVELKKHKVLFEALRSCPDVQLDLVGVGPLKQELVQDAKARGVYDRVRFIGQLPRDREYALLCQADIYVSSSSFEGLPISVLEAMSCGVVCAVSDIEQHREIQEKCPSLITVKNTAEDWVKAIEKIAAMSADDRAKIGSQNKTDVDRCFSLARMHAQYDQVYDEVARGTTK